MTLGSRRQRFLIGAAAALGLAIMAYLTYIHYAAVRSFCDLSAEVSCDVVTTSIYSELFGVPMSIIGLGYFLTVLVLVFRRDAPETYRLIFLLTAFSLIPSLYLTLVEIFSIRSICVLCETSKVLMAVILAATYPVVRQRTRGLGQLVAPVVIAGVVAAAVMYFAQTGTASKTDYTGLIEHLNQQGWTYYRSYTCANCQRQEMILGKAYPAVRKVECHPKGPGGNPELCLQKNITKTPTWLLEQDGREVKRLEGLQQIEELMRQSGYQPAAGR